MSKEQVDQEQRSPALNPKYTPDKVGEGSPKKSHENKPTETQAKEKPVMDEDAKMNLEL